jgi:AcrR family transcriptional regulator
MGERSNGATRHAILEATRALLFELGADRLTIRKVEDRSGFKAPTIYHHFRDKTGLIDSLLEEDCADLHARLCEVPRIRSSICASWRAPICASACRTPLTTR